MRPPPPTQPPTPCPAPPPRAGTGAGDSRGERVRGDAAGRGAAAPTPRTHLGGLGLQRHQPRGRIGQHVEVGGGGGAHGGGPALGVHLVVDEAPLLQEGVNPAESRAQTLPRVPPHPAPRCRAHRCRRRTHRMMAQTSPARLRRQAVEVRYSCGFSRYVSIMKLRYAKYLRDGSAAGGRRSAPARRPRHRVPRRVWPHISGVLDLFLPLKNSGRARRSMAWTLREETLGEGPALAPGGRPGAPSSPRPPCTCCSRTRRRSWG